MLLNNNLEFEEELFMLKKKIGFILCLVLLAYIKNSRGVIIYENY